MDKKRTGFWQWVKNILKKRPFLCSWIVFFLLFYITDTQNIRPIDSYLFLPVFFIPYFNFLPSFLFRLLFYLLSPFYSKRLYRLLSNLFSFIYKFIQRYFLLFRLLPNVHQYIQRISMSRTNVFLQNGPEIFPAD